MSRKANGLGSVRKITKTTDGKTYTYWQARYTVGVDPGTGKQIQKSVNGKTQKEAATKLKQLIIDFDNGLNLTKKPVKVDEWLLLWHKNYIPDVKPRTRDSYLSNINRYLIPNLGKVKLDKLEPESIQAFYGRLSTEHDLSPKTIKNINGVLHEAMDKAVELGYIRNNPTDPCKIPKIPKRKIKPFDEDDIANFVSAIKGHKYEELYLVTLFAGLREGEVLGLTWDCVDFRNSILTIDKQLQKQRDGSGVYNLVPTKNDKERYLTIPQFLVDVLQKRKLQQENDKRLAGDAWEKSKLVFTNELGHNLSAQTVYLHFKKIAIAIGRPDARFHDLRHSYAVASLQNGDDIKTLQENLGHHTAAFTLDTYGHVIDKMRKASANNMQRFIDSLCLQ